MMAVSVKAQTEQVMNPSSEITRLLWSWQHVFWVFMKDEEEKKGRQENGGNSRSTARIKGKYARFGTLLCGSGMRARNLCEWGGGSADGSALSRVH